MAAVRIRNRLTPFSTFVGVAGGETHDAAAQVYVVFDNQYLPRVVKYIWSAALPTGTSFTNPLYGRGRVVVLRSGSSRKGEWHQETINFYHDYKELFGEAPGQVQASVFYRAQTLPGASSSLTTTTLPCFRNNKGRR
jgi:hypothetical protein